LSLACGAWLWGTQFRAAREYRVAHVWRVRCAVRCAVRSVLACASHLVRCRLNRTMCVMGASSAPRAAGACCDGRSLPADGVCAYACMLPAAALFRNALLSPQWPFAFVFCRAEDGSYISEILLSTTPILFAVQCKKHESVSVSGGPWYCLCFVKQKPKPASQSCHMVYKLYKPPAPLYRHTGPRCISTLIYLQQKQGGVGMFTLTPPSLLSLM